MFVGGGLKNQSLTQKSSGQKKLILQKIMPYSNKQTNKQNNQKQLQNTHHQINRYK